MRGTAPIWRHLSDRENPRDTIARSRNYLFWGQGLRGRDSKMSEKKQTRKIGILTGGGDCPGLNAVLRGVVRRGMENDFEVVGFKNGWLGAIDGRTMPLDMNSVSGILPKGGTILGTSRTNPMKQPDGLEKIK